MPQKRNWYQQINVIDSCKDADKCQVPVQFPKSRWDSEDEEALSTDSKKQELDEPADKLHASLEQRK